MDKWGQHPALYAFEPVNEPWQHSDLPTLKDFYRSARDIIRKSNPDVKFVFHDSFLTSHRVWNDLFADDDSMNVVMDTHKYLAWNHKLDTIDEYCQDFTKQLLGDALQKVKYDVWVGEWSLATDVCAMWLGGFNDSNTAYQFECKQVECPKTYIPDPFGTDFDRTDPWLGPFGEETRSTIRKGMCFTDSDYFSSEEIKKLGACTREIFDQAV